MEYYSPLRYPGGKAKVASYFKKIIGDNILYDGTYVEPYAGGAAVALALLFNEYVSKIIINDIDHSIYAFWHSVLNQSDELCSLIRATPVSIKTWRLQREIQRDKQNHGLLSIGFSTFFLNRTNRSGILNGGVIGGLSQRGEWSIDARYNKAKLIERINKIAQYSDRIELHNMDAIKLIRSLRTRLSKKTLFYFDPPYYVKGKELYYSFYKANDHRKIATEISKLKKQKWVVTYDNVMPIRKLYTGHRKTKFSLNYSVAHVGKGEEIMIFSDNLYIPKCPIIESAVSKAKHLGGFALST